MNKYLLDQEDEVCQAVCLQPQMHCSELLLGSLSSEKDSPQDQVYTIIMMEHI